MEVYCGGTDGQACPQAPGYAAEADLYAADLTLVDARPPDWDPRRAADIHRFIESGTAPPGMSLPQS